MTTPDVGCIGVYRGPRYRWWQHNVKFVPWSEFRHDGVYVGEFVHVEMISYNPWVPYRRRKQVWKTFYRGGGRA